MPQGNFHFWFKGKTKSLFSVRTIAIFYNFLNYRIRTTSILILYSYGRIQYLTSNQ